MELALVLPILFLVILAIFWFGLAFHVASTTERAAKQAAQFAAKPICTSCGNSFPLNTQVITTLNSALQAGHLDPANITSYSPSFACSNVPAPTCSSPGNVEICTNAPLTCGSVKCQNPPAACGSNPSLGVRVSFRYNFKSPIPMGSWNQITIPASAAVQQEDDR
jgi:Flp pilus assembly protein TadG